MAAIYSLLLISLIQPSAPRMLASLSFASLFMLHTLIDHMLTDYVYYAISAIFGLLIMFIISSACRVSQVVLSIHKICLASIVINGIGCLFWYSYISPVYYNIAFFILYLWTIKTLLGRDGRYDVRGFTADCWRLSFCYNHDTWLKCISPRKEKI